ncbi:MAG: Flp family type IVb pilin [Acidobacteria bacterium]|nr:MAG: Flp family type IVb pilin [Acidobacteriota bacterium]
MFTLFQHLSVFCSRLRRDERGVTTIEYAIMLVMVGLAVALAAPNVRTAVISVFNAVSGALVTAGG